MSDPDSKKHHGRGPSRASPDFLDLCGHVLIAMPGMIDDRFARSVVLVCNHDTAGSMGLVLNQPVSSPPFEAILTELKLEKCKTTLQEQDRTVPVFRGGPVEQGRGFVLHSLDYTNSSSTRLGDLAAVSSTLDALRRLCGSQPPEQSQFLLGYAGWGPGQLESEIADNGWLSVKATPDIIFGTPHESQYDRALAEMGVSEASLSAFSGRA
ncbi:MAG: YqgE/AlgH family protein [Pseudomonadota bacterium]